MYKKLFILFLIFFSKLESLPYKYQRLYRPEDGRCVDLISDIHLPQNPSESESKLTSIIEELNKTSTEPVDLFVEGTLEEIKECESDDGNFYGFFMKKLPAKFIDKKPNHLDVKLIEPRIDQERYLAYGYRAHEKLGWFTEHIKKLIDSIIDYKDISEQLKEYDLKPRDKQFLTEKIKIFIEKLREFYSLYFRGKEEISLLTFLSNSKQKGAKFFWLRYSKDYLEPFFDIVMLLNILSSSNKHNIVYAGGAHCENISKDLQKLGFKKIIEKKANIFNFVKNIRIMSKVYRYIQKLKNVKPKSDFLRYLQSFISTKKASLAWAGLTLAYGELSKDTWDSLLKDSKEQYKNLPNPVVIFIKNHPVLCAGTASLGLYYLSKCL